MIKNKGIVPCFYKAKNMSICLGHGRLMAVDCCELALSQEMASGDMIRFMP